jgi:hypothetical protein
VRETIEVRNVERMALKDDYKYELSLGGEAGGKKDINKRDFRNQ